MKRHYSTRNGETKNLLFTYYEHKKFLENIHKKYKIHKLKDWNSEPGIILRYDVDFSLEAARNIAEIQEEIGIRSSFFIRLTSSFYNPMSIENREILKYLTKNDFEVGLHFDPSVYKVASHHELLTKLKQEFSILESITDQNLESVSLHNPSVTGEYPIFAEYKNAYSDLIFNKDIYLSDSRMKFRMDPYEFIQRADDNVLQIVFHPSHFTKRGDDYLPIIQELTLNYLKKVEKEISVNSTYKELVKNSLLSDRLTWIPNTQ